jgi:two-component system, OmpR family, KDP operon response regulator KdpE
LKLVRESGSCVPVIVMSSRGDEPTKVAALDLGADDFVVKPFSMDELLARIRAAIRHRLQQKDEAPVFKNGDLVIDSVHRIVTVRGDEVKLTPREYDLLRLLAANTGRVLTHKFILSEVWGSSADVRHVRIYIRTLRQKIEAHVGPDQLIQTEQGVGYRLRAIE